MISARSGDILESRMQTITNTVNCVGGVMGKGLELEFKRHFPDMFRDYADRCRKSAVVPGKPYTYRDMLGVTILNFPTKHHWREASRLADIEDGLAYLADHYQEMGITSLAMEPLGCGNGGLSWDVVGPLIYRKLSALPIDVVMYAPFGTPIEQLTDEFLSSSASEE